MSSVVDVISAAKLIWDYHQLHQVLKPADCILVFGSSDLRVAS